MDVRQKLTAGEYDTKVPYGIEEIPVNEETMTVKQAREHKEAEHARKREQRDLHNKDQARLIGLFRADLEAEHGLSQHPRAALLYSIAYDEGHSEGLEQVVNWYERLADLLK